ncbi:peptidoglycan-binding protein [Actinomadura decatromicini]|uniref:Peptidoglycan-binding protein n=2 Tax=Actinomadura decatromicini TaxID=2604572 RepID=A0A5D3FU55_9ACTN|nr:peptidoglycan-binding protein [Actinomadura decatromicini]
MGATLSTTYGPLVVFSQIALFDWRKCAREEITMPAPPFQPPEMKYPPITSGATVRQWQQQMKNRGWNLVPDGKYGPISERICVNFQREHRLEPDGIVGPITWRAAWEAPSTLAPQAPAEVLHVGSYGDAVAVWEEQADHRGWPVKHVDSSFDEETAAACKALQAAYGLPVTGNVDYQTWDAAWREAAPA